MSRFLGLTGATNPFDGFAMGFDIMPSLADIDGDGDLDLIVGRSNGPLRFYRNTGTATAPAYAEQTGTANPVDGINVGTLKAPTLGDIDGDGDLDLLVGEFEGFVHRYLNTGSATAPVYVLQNGPTSPFDGIDVGVNSAPSLGDVDGDGDLDLLIGESDGRLNFYRNTGSATAPAYAEQTGADNPFSGILGSTFSNPSLGDIDGDGDLDLILGRFSGFLEYHRNTGTARAPAYVAQTGTDNPFDGVRLGRLSSPTLGDIDGDGDLDLVFGNGSGTPATFIQNDAPTLSQAAFNLTGTQEDADSAAVAVSSLLASAGWADVDARALQGLAITGSTGAGWQYRVDGSTWTPVGAATATAAVLLGADTQLRYAPDRANGEIATLSFRAWDQSSGSASTDGSPSTANTSSNGGESAFSSAISTASLAVTSLNDAPTLNQAAINLPQTDEETVRVVTASELLALAGWGDVDTGAMRGIAISTATGLGGWEWSPNGSSSWNVLTPSQGSAFGVPFAALFNQNAAFRYTPNGTNGETATLNFRAWDQTAGIPSGNINGNLLLNALREVATEVGGTGSMSSTLSTASLLVNPVNDAPTLSVSAGTLSPGTDEDTPSQTFSVADLLAAAGWADVDSGPLKGLAMTGVLGSGRWDYSPDGGTTWLDPRQSSDYPWTDSRRLLLDDTTLLRYVPDGRDGETASISFRAWDRSDGRAATSTTIRSFDTNGISGGTSAYSSTNATLSLAVAAVNDAPTLSRSVITVTGTDEDTTSAPLTVADLLRAAGIADVDLAASGNIAITGSIGKGHWEYSAGTFNANDPVSKGGKAPSPAVAPGSEWTPLGTVSDAAALLLRSNALLRYVPDGENGETASLSFRAWDQTSGSASADGARSTGDASTNGGSSAFSATQTTANLAVSPLNDVPTTSPVTLTPVHEDTPLTINPAMLLSKADDVDRPPQTLSVTNLQVSAGLGSVVNAGPGVWQFNPAPNDDTQVSFSYTISDGEHTIPGSAKLDLLPVNDPPVAVADAAQTPMGTAVNIAVIANDSDVDGGPLSVSGITQGSSGGVAIRADGVSVRYTPNAGFSGFDTFTYTANDGAGGTAVGTVRVLVPSYMGTAGNDVPLGTPQADFMVTGDGNDRVLSYDGADYIDGGRGADTLSGGLGADTLLGGDGADTFITTAAELAGDSIDGGGATDTLQITDPIAVMPAVFTLVNVEQLSFPGSLQVGHTSLLDLSALTLSGAGNQINGGTAASRITGTRSADRITDSAGNDDLRGGDGNDTIMAGVGQDTVHGGNGNDTLGGSSSTLGDGSVDTFVFNTALNGLTNVDTVIGFEANGRDVIALDSSIFASIGPTLDASEFRSAIGGNAADANDFILFDPATGALYYDADGTGPIARIQFATLGAGLTGTVDFSDLTVSGFGG